MTAKDYRIWATDIDGTLIDSDKVLRKETEQAIEALKEAGIIFTLASGRSILTMTEFMHLLSADAPIINFNGARIVRNDTREVIYKRDLEASDAAAIYEYAAQKGTSLIMWSGEQVYCNKKSKYVDDYGYFVRMDPIVVTPGDIDSLALKGVTKYLWIDEPENIQAILPSFAERFGEAFNYCTSVPSFLECNHKDVSKGNALRMISKLYGIESNAFIASGDGFNDLDMIQFAGLGIAMGNAAEGVKSHADFVTKTNDEDGIGYAIRTLLGN